MERGRRRREVPASRGPETPDEATERSGEPRLPRKTARKAPAPVPQTDTGGRVEHTEAIGSTMVKELGKMAP